MRRTQFFGLKNDVNDWLEKNCKCRFFKHSNREVDANGDYLSDLDNSTSIQTCVVSTDTGEIITGMFDERVHSLLKYTTTNGCEVEEYVQSERWSSGPCIFLALRYSGTKEPIKESLWSDVEIDNA